MSYMRDPWYAYRCNDGVQLYGPGGEEVVLPEEVFDALVVMRHAQLAEHPEQLAIIEAAVAEEFAGNFGVDALRQRLGLTSVADAMTTLLEQLGHRFQPRPPG